MCRVESTSFYSYSQTTEWVDAQSNASHLLKLTTVPYYVNGKKGLKEEKTTFYHIKGLRGALRHRAMALCHAKGIEICHSHDKKENKDKNPIHPPRGLHHIGDCLPDNECILHSVFGSKRHPSKFRLSVTPIAFTRYATAECDRRVQWLQISTENRVCLSLEGKAVQNFEQRYFSGEFELELDVSNCDPTQRGMLIKAVTTLNRLGGAFNAGYGTVEICSFELVKRTEHRKVIRQANGGFKIDEEVHEELLDDEALAAMEAWQQYVAARA